MLTFHNYISLVLGIFLIIYSCTIILFPPKFGSVFYGINTKWTIKNKDVWNYGQKLFAVSLFIIGLVFSILGFFKLDDSIPPYPMFVLIIILWALSKFIVHKILAKKYSVIH